MQKHAISWDLEQPLWLCGFRPFFLLAAASASLLMALWGLLLWFGWPAPPVAGGMLVWHAHELLFGFTLAALAGFALTAVPEFAQGADVSRRAVRRLVLLWLLGRAGFWLSGLVGPFGLLALLLAAFAHVSLLLGLLWLLGPLLWRDPQRRHLSFFWAFVVLTLVVAGFYVDALRGVVPTRWLDAFIGVMMVLIVIALSRVSVVLVNRAIDELNAQADAEINPENEVNLAQLLGARRGPYLARPPRRNLAIFCIAAYTGAAFFLPASKFSGWLALAAASALFNLLNDWHVGRALWRRWALMLYGVYLFMAVGYGTIGWAILSGNGAFSAGRHLLTVGALGLSTYAVICIAGRMHCGYELDERRWLPLGAALLALAALARAAVAIPGANAHWLMALAAACWLAAFSSCLVHLWPLFVGPRPDQQHGCAGPALAPGSDT